MAKKKPEVPEYGTITLKGTQYYRTRIMDADGKQVSLYATTCEELYEKELEARRQVEEIIFHRQHPTVAEYCEKWLLMQSAKVSASTLRGYTRDMKNYIIKPLGEMYMEEVTSDDVRLALVPLSKKSEGLYNKVNMLLKCVFYTAERNQILEHNPCDGISGKGGKPAKKREALTDQQVAVLLDISKRINRTMPGSFPSTMAKTARACIWMAASTPSGTTPRESVLPRVRAPSVPVQPSSLGNRRRPVSGNCWIWAGICPKASWIGWITMKSMCWPTGC